MPATHRNVVARLENYAPLFAALGDATRLSIVSQLAHGQARSISQLTKGSGLTRQAVTKHLRVLENVGLVRSNYSGRENLFELDMRPFKDITEYLEFVSSRWDQALARLKSFVEQER
jgi:DNA-binding transcriptional ArsR family regulator